MAALSRRRARREGYSDSESEEQTRRRLLPARSSRGTRINKLIGEEAEADEAFWGQDAWQEDASDDDYSTEEEEEDVVDADFDEEEQPDEDVHDADAEDDKPRRKRAAAGQTKAYREPSARGSAAKKARRQAAAATSTGTEVVARHSPTDATKPPTPLFYEGPRVRSSTARKSTKSSELRRRASEEAARLAAKLKKPTVDKGSARLTQAQLLAEAVRTEVENMQSLNRLEQLEEEKKAEAMTPKAPFTGQMVRYYSRIGMPKTITFLNTAAFPPLFNQPKPKKRVSTQEKLEQLRREVDNDSSADENDDGDEEHGRSADEPGSSDKKCAAKKKVGRARSASGNSAASTIY